MSIKETQFVQCFQLSIDDLKVIIKEAVERAIPPQQSIQASDSNLSIADLDFNDELLSPKEVSGILKLSHTTLWRHNKDGILKRKSKIGRKVYYSKREVYNFLNNVA